ncbi:MAG: DUF1801 domain-containing protein [Ginsengibacter sp.]
MGNKDYRVDAYVEKSAPFAKPILQHLRKLVYKASPDISETIKWGMPFFEYKGTLCNMASFKQHCAFGFWKAALMKDSVVMKGKNESAMGHLGKITTMKDLPADSKIIGWIKEAMELNDENKKLSEIKKEPKKGIPIPAAFQKALEENTKAALRFQKLSPSHKYEYFEWIAGAKAEDTMKKRIKTSLEWLEEGKSRNWKYEKK